MKKLELIIEDIFSLQPEDIDDSISSDTVKDWDSMNYLRFIAEIEKQYEIQFTIDEVMEAENLGAIKNIMRSKGVSL